MVDNDNILSYTNDKYDLSSAVDITFPESRSQSTRTELSSQSQSQQKYTLLIRHSPTSSPTSTSTYLNRNLVQKVSSFTNDTLHNSHLSIFSYSLFLSIMLFLFMIYLLLPRGLRQFMCNAYPKRFARSVGTKQTDGKYSIRNSDYFEQNPNVNTYLNPHERHSLLQSDRFSSAHMKSDSRNSAHGSMDKFHNVTFSKRYNLANDGRVDSGITRSRVRMGLYNATNGQDDRMTMYDENSTDSNQHECNTSEDSSGIIANRSMSSFPKYDKIRNNHTLGTIQNSISSFFGSEAGTSTTYSDQPQHFNTSGIIENRSVSSKHNPFHDYDSEIQKSSSYLFGSEAGSSGFTSIVVNSEASFPNHLHPHENPTPSTYRRANFSNLLTTPIATIKQKIIDSIGSAEEMKSIPKSSKDLLNGSLTNIKPTRLHYEDAYDPFNDESVSSSSFPPPPSMVSIQSIASSIGLRSHSSSTHSQDISPKHPDPNHQVPCDIVLTATMSSLVKPGVRLFAHGIQSEPRRIWIKLHPEKLTLSWRTESIPESNRGILLGPLHEIPLLDILYIDVGKTTAALRLLKDVKEDTCFSLLTKNGSLDLRAGSKTERDSLVSCFCLILDTVQLEESANMSSTSSAVSSSLRSDESGKMNNMSISWRELSRTEGSVVSSQVTGIKSEISSSSSRGNGGEGSAFSYTTSDGYNNTLRDLAYESFSETHTDFTPSTNLMISQGLENLSNSQNLQNDYAVI